MPTGPRSRLSDHVDAICEAVEAAGGPVVLAVHSGAGFSGYVASDRVPERIAAMVYVDTAPGIPPLDPDFEGAEKPMSWEELSAEENLDGLSEEQLETFRQRAVPEPGGVLRDAVELTNDARLDIPSTLICTGYTSQEYKERDEGGLLLARRAQRGAQRHLGRPADEPLADVVAPEGARRDHRRRREGTQSRLTVLREEVWPPSGAPPAQGCPWARAEAADMRRSMIIVAAAALVLSLTHPALAAPPANDDFADAAVLSGTTGEVVGSTADATEEAGEPLHGVDPAGMSIWYRWTAPADGTLLLTIVGNEGDTLLAVYTGDQVSDLTPVAREEQTLPFRLFFRISAGTEYRIAVDSDDMGSLPPSTAPFTLSWTFYEPPANDDFAGAEPLSGTTGALTAHNGGATAETGEPEHGGEVGGVSLWYAWSPPDPGAFRFDVSSSEFSPLVAIYTGTELDALTEVASTSGEPLFMHQTVELDADPTSDYLIAIDSPFEYIGEFDLSWRPLGPPNDDLIDIAVLDGPGDLTSVDTTFAAKEVGEPNHAGNAGGASAWYDWTAPWKGTATFTAEAEGFEPLLALYVGGPWGHDDMEDLVPFQSDVGSGGVASITLPVAGDLPGHFVIAVDGENSGDGAGRGQIDLSVEYHPSNDDLADAEPIGCCSGGWWAYTGGATTEAGEPDHAGSPAANSVWFSFTAELAGTMEFFTTGEFVPGRIAVYDGATMDTLALLDESPPAADGTNRAEFDVEVGQTYLLAFDSAGGVIGEVGIGFGMLVETPESQLAPVQVINASTVPILVAWEGPQGGDSYFEVEKQKSGGAWTQVTTTIDTATTVPLTPSAPYRFRVRASIPGGTTEWATSDQTTVDLVQDGAAAVRYRGTWRTASAASASGGTMHTSVDVGATAKLVDTGRTFAVVAPRGPRFGKAALFVDGVFVRNINFYAAQTSPRRVVFRRSWALSGAHRIVLKVLGKKDSRSAGTRIPLDTFVVAS